jgi:hypothetical protein
MNLERINKNEFLETKHNILYRLIGDFAYLSSKSIECLRALQLIENKSEEYFQEFISDYFINYASDIIKEEIKNITDNIDSDIIITVSDQDYNIKIKKLVFAKNYYQYLILYQMWYIGSSSNKLLLFKNGAKKLISEINKEFSK